MTKDQATMIPAEGVRDELRIAITIPLPRDPFEQAKLLGKLAPVIDRLDADLSGIADAVTMQRSVVTTRPPKTPKASA